jgi:hypothetical protein
MNAPAGGVTGPGMNMKLSMETVTAVGAAIATPTTTVNRSADAMAKVTANRREGKMRFSPFGVRPRASGR